MNPSASEPASPWSGARWILVVTLIAAFQAAAWLWLARFPQLPDGVRARGARTDLQLAAPDSASPELGNWLGDPRLFAWRDPVGFSGLAQKALPAPEYRLAEWQVTPRWLAVSADPHRLGPIPPLTAPAPLPPPAIPAPTLSQTPTPLLLEPRTTVRWQGDLSKRAVRVPHELGPLTGTEVLAPTVVELAVSPGGALMMTRLVGSSGNREADQQSLDWLRSLVFEPAAHEPSPGGSDPRTWTTGRLVVTWWVSPTPR